MEQILQPVMFEIPDRTDVVSIVIGETPYSTARSPATYCRPPIREPRTCTARGRKDRLP